MTAVQIINKLRFLRSSLMKFHCIRCETGCSDCIGSCSLAFFSPRCELVTKVWYVWCTGEMGLRDKRMERGFPQRAVALHPRHLQKSAFSSSSYSRRRPRRSRPSCNEHWTRTCIFAREILYLHPAFGQHLRPDRSCWLTVAEREEFGIRSRTAGLWLLQLKAEAASQTDEFVIVQRQQLQEKSFKFSRSCGNHRQRSTALWR